MLSRGPDATTAITNWTLPAICVLANPDNGHMLPRAWM
jgi:hypothetical protein